MAIRQLAIPTDESGFKVELAYLERWSPSAGPGSPLTFLARGDDTAGVGEAGDGDLGEGESESVASRYRRNLPLYRRDFGELLGDRAYELVLSPPSRRADLEPYRREIVARGIARTDLSDRLRRTGHATSRGQSFDQLIDAFAFEGDDALAGAKSLLIVDDYFVTGRTAAALLSILRSQGFPSDGQVTVACPLWVDHGATK
ncbi:MAG: hypothetical protein OEO23_01575 [Gemmatimonadota bacterium]|nr:hypothetical protein [Gemmatimonadota bacterium]